MPADALRELGRLYRCVMVVATQQYLTSLRNLTKWYEMGAADRYIGVPDTSAIPPLEIVNVGR